MERRRQHPIQTTEALTAIVCEARDFTLRRAAGAKLHPAARTFQALRMLMNREPANLERLLAVAPDLLKPGGRIAIIDDFRRVTLTSSGTHRQIGGRFARQDKGHRTEMSAFLAAVRRGLPSPISFGEVVKTTQLSFAAVESLQSGRPVTL